MGGGEEKEPNAVVKDESPGRTEENFPGDLKLVVEARGEGRGQCGERGCRVRSLRGCRAGQAFGKAGKKMLERERASLAMAHQCQPVCSQAPETYDGVTLPRLPPQPQSSAFWYFVSISF